MSLRGLFDSHCSLLTDVGLFIFIWKGFLPFYCFSIGEFRVTAEWAAI